MDLLEVGWASVDHLAVGQGRILVLFGRFAEVGAGGTLLDVGLAGVEFFEGEDLRFVEASRPDIELALEAEGETAFDVLHGFFQRDVGGRREQGVQVIGHDDEGVELEASLIAVVGECLEEEVGVGFDLK